MLCAIISHRAPYAEECACVPFISDKAFAGHQAQDSSDIGVVEGEVFENERFLPFRGWGHEWPGHLLPTDRVGHWSLRGDRPSGAESMDFHRVAPPLPQVCTLAFQRPSAISKCAAAHCTARTSLSHTLPCCALCCSPSIVKHKAGQYGGTHPECACHYFTLAVDRVSGTCQ